MKKIALFISICLIALANVSDGQVKKQKKPAFTIAAKDTTLKFSGLPQLEKVYVFREKQIDSIITFIKNADRVLYRRGSGISLDETNDLTQLQTAIENFINIQTLKLNPDLRRRIDSLKKANQQK